MKNNNYNFVCWVFWCLEDVCFIEIERNFVILFGGIGCFVKCDERKFNYKVKVSIIMVYNCFVLYVSCEFSGDYYSECCVEN